MLDEVLDIIVTLEDLKYNNILIIESFKNFWFTFSVIVLVIVNILYSIKYFFIRCGIFIFVIF